MPVLPFQRSFTMSANGVANRIVSDVGVSPPFDPKGAFEKPPNDLIQTKGLWDTGATRSVLTSATIKKLNLAPVGVVDVAHAGGVSKSNTYLVNLYLPNMVAIAGVLVTECEDIVGDFGVILGMDVITRGDFAITNLSGKTVFSFRLPSLEVIDFVDEYSKATGQPPLQSHPASGAPS